MNRAWLINLLLPLMPLLYHHNTSFCTLEKLLHFVGEKLGTLDLIKANDSSTALSSSSQAVDESDFKFEASRRFMVRLKLTLIKVAM